MFLYSLYDAKAESFLPILEASNDSHAKRLIADALAQGLPVKNHPDDYQLWRIATYDNQSGFVTQDTRPSLVCSVLAIVSEYFKDPLTNGHDTTETPQASNDSPQEPHEGEPLDS